MRTGRTWKTKRTRAAGATSTSTNRRRWRLRERAAPLDAPPRARGRFRTRATQGSAGHDRGQLLPTLREGLGDVLALADQRLGGDVREGGVDLRPLLEVVGGDDVVRGVDQGRLQQDEERMLLGERGLHPGDRRDARRRLEEVAMVLLGLG